MLGGMFTGVSGIPGFLGDALGQSRSQTASGIFGTSGAGGGGGGIYPLLDPIGLSNNPKLDPLHLFPTNQPGGANWLAAHPGEQPVGQGTPMQTGITPDQQGGLNSAYMQFLSQLNPAMMAGFQQQMLPAAPGGSPQGGMQARGNTLPPGLAALMGGGLLNGMAVPQMPPSYFNRPGNPIGRPQPQ